MNDMPSKYRIRFISGELSGRVFAVGGAGMKIGRAKTADIRPGGEDIAAEHITLMPQLGSGVLLLVHGIESAWVNGEEISGGQSVMLIPGADVRIGKELSFVLESEEATEELTEEATAGAPAADGAHTRYASPAELDELRSFSRSEKRRRKFVLAAGILLFVCIIAGAYAYTVLEQENPLTWPGEVSGNYNDGEVRTEIEPFGKCLVYFPKTAATVQRVDGNNCEIMTALGKNMDVPFHLVFTVTPLPEGFRTTRKQSFDNWRKRVSEQNGFAFLSDPEQDFYRPTESGFPYYSISYTRIDKKIRWQGYASYMRYQDKELVLLREVPVNHFWRSERVLRRFGAFVVSPTMVDHYWEIPGKRMEFNPTRLLQRCALELRKNIAVAVWDDLDLALCTLLCRAYETKDQILIDAVVPLWLDFRTKQQVWYSQNCLAYQTAQASQNLQEMTRIVNDCLRRFPSPDDHRHVKIMKNIWTIEE